MAWDTPLEKQAFKLLFYHRIAMEEDRKCKKKVKLENHVPKKNPQHHHC
jgi:hypothetical protein